MFKKHPKGLIPAALSNMGERFGYYIMAAVLSLFLCSKFGLADEKAALIYSIFLAAIYILSLVGGIIADRTQNYKRTIQWGIIIMAIGYVLLAIPITATEGTMTMLLVLTCGALILIAFGNGLFKGNLQAIVGQMYDDMEAKAAADGKSEAELKAIKGRRDTGFQIFYVFINIGGLIAPFIAPLLRTWWLGRHDFKYVAELPSLCHKYIEAKGSLPADQLANLTTYLHNAGIDTVDVNACQNYLTVFNQGVHFAFIASVIAMLVSLVIFLAKKRIFPTPGKKVAADAVELTPAEKQSMAKELKQRLYALFAVLGVVIFFWFSFHQNGVSLSFFARDFVKSDQLPAELWQAVNPFFVIVLTPIIMIIFGALSKRGKEISTPRKIAYGMFIAGLAYAFLAIYSYCAGYPSGTEFKAMDAATVNTMKAGPWVMIATYFLLTVAELFISPLGLSFVSKVAPKTMLGLCQGLWLGTTAVGNMLLPIGTLMYNKIPLWECWGVFICVCFISMGVMLAMVKWLERVTSDKS